MTQTERLNWLAIACIVILEGGGVEEDMSVEGRIFAH